ncbi:hypothetical protein [Microbacterium luticocti]|uniref:hypothetical protein n=1 Tax=Microbacterium luticocti TaxID=451764 RepID=UPI00041224AF|nr:hypothetical protein [Microbacterium luticocti]
MQSDLAFFSLIELADPSLRGEYNRWHQLDHRPENLALPGVAWGDRWQADDAHKALARGDSAFAGTDFVAMYWFRPPADEAVAEWDALGETSFQWGRGPLIPGVRRSMLAFFRPVKGYAAPRALVAPDVLPYRPHRGVHVTVTRFAEPHSSEAHDAHRYEDREVIPKILGVDGVAGAWTFSFSHAQTHRTLPFSPTTDDGPGSIRIRLVYLEDDPLAVAPQLVEAAGEPRSAAETLLTVPLKTIIPWQDW